MEIDATASMTDAPAEESETTLSEDLAAAWEASENGTATVEQPASGGAAPADGSGDSAPAGERRETTAEGGKEPAAKDAETVPKGEGVAEAGAQSAGAGVDQPPVSLSPEAREAWKTTPKAMQTAITEREREYTVGLQKHADNAARAVQMDQALEPFRQYIGMAGGPPAQVIGNLLQTASILQMGSPIQRAQQVAALITQFGVNIDSLAAALDGVAQPQGVQQQSEVATAVSQAMAPYQQYFQQQQQYQQQQLQEGQQVVTDDIATFAKDPQNEFYNDVKMDMADIFDLAERRGLEMTMANAYTKACLIRPDIQAIISGRAGQALVDKRRVTASSIRGTPGGGGGGAEGLSRRDALSDAWDEAARQG